MFEALGRVMYRRRRRVVTLAVVLVAFAAVWGTGVFGALTGSGFEDPGSESSRAAAVVTRELGRQTSSDVVVLYRSATTTVDDPAFRAAVTGTLGALPKDVVVGTTSFWSTHSPALVSADRHATYAVLALKNGKSDLDRVTGSLAAPGLRTGR